MGGSTVDTFWGYDQDVCGTWLDYKLNSLPDVVKSQYQKWNVNWVVKKSEPQVDGSYNEPLTDGDADTYSEDPRDVEPYNDAVQDAEPYSDDTKVAEPYSDDTKDAEPYSDDTKDAEPYSDATKDAEPYSEATKDAEPYSEDQVVDVAKTADPYRR